MAISVTGLLKSFGPLTVIRSISFELAGNEFLTLLGPSGCGKTTTLRCIAGLDVPDGGVIEIDGQVLSDPAGGVFVPPQERRLGMVFQSYAIWPHLTVAENVAFPLTVRGVRNTAEPVRWALGVVGMEALAGRRPSELSGGQQQRVALARAIVGEPKVLLFDEPLSNLDARLRDRTRAEISRIQRELGVPAVYVTHDQAEALAMSDRVIVMNAGEIVQQGSPRALYRHPANRFVADFLGQANFLALRADGGSWRMPDGTPIQISAEDTAGAAGGSRVAVLRPEAVALVAGAAEARANALPGRVVEATYLGPWVECLVETGGAQIRALSREDLPPGADVLVTFSPEDCSLLPAEAS